MLNQKLFYHIFYFTRSIGTLEVRGIRQNYLLYISCGRHKNTDFDLLKNVNKMIKC